MSTYADVLYEVADALGAEARHLEREDASIRQRGSARRLRELIDLVHASLSEKDGDVLSAEEISRITRKYDSSGSWTNDVMRLVASHEELRRQRDAR